MGETTSCASPSQEKTSPEGQINESVGGWFASLRYLGIATYHPPQL